MLDLSEGDATRFHFARWPDFIATLGGTCKQGDCKNVQTCTTCKFWKDESQYSPKGSAAQYVDQLPQLLQLVVDANRQHGWVTDCPLRTLQRLSDLLAGQHLGAPVRNTLSHWGAAICPPAVWHLIPGAPHSYAFHKVDLRVDGVPCSRYRVSTDVGNDLYEHMVKDVWQIDLTAWPSGQGTTKGLLGDVVEALFAIPYLEPFFPSISGQLPSRLR